MKLKYMIVLAALLGTTVSGFAVDAPVAATASNDKDMGIRVSLGVAPGISELELSGISGTGTIEDDTGGQLEVLFQRRHWSKNNPNLAGIWGAGVFLCQCQRKG